MITDAEYFDALETRQSAAREAHLFNDFGTRLAHLTAQIPGLANHLNAHDVGSVNDRDALATLPVLRKPALMEAQQAHPPFGQFVNTQALGGTRVFMSPGPVYEPQPSGADPWQSARALFAAGFRSGDVVHNAFSYHQTPGGFILDQGAIALGCQVFPGGVGNTEAQVAAAAALKPTGFVGTPDYLLQLLDFAAENRVDLSSFQRALVSGGALFPSLRDTYLSRGVTVLQAYATADLGVIAYETQCGGMPGEGLLVNEGIIVEIVRPGTDTPVPAGEVGEVVVTRLDECYPLVRFGTGDLSAVLPGVSNCGRTAMRLKGWMGRADQRTKVRGMFVDPAQIAQLESEHAFINRLRLVVTRHDNNDVPTLHAHVQPGTDTGSNASALIADSAQRVIGLKCQVQMVSESAKNDGLVIEDQRQYDD